MKYLAIDIGTTNIAAVLIDAGKKKVLSTASLPNSQKKFGFDVITRLHVAGIRGQKVMHELVIKDINRIIDGLEAGSKGIRKDIGLVYVAANTVMLHFLFGIDASGLSTAPFRSKFPRIASAMAANLDIKLGVKAKIEALPVISPFIGADLVAGLYGSGSIGRRNIIFIDLGTNAEIAVISKKGIYAASAAAGPAFKSKKIPFGSELIAKVSDLLTKGSIDRSGRIIKKCGIEQKDVRSLQVAKAAIASAIQVLLKKANIANNEVQEVQIAGIFGEKLNIRDIQNIKLLPVLTKAKVRLIGDSVLDGLTKLIMSDKKPKDMLSLARKVIVVELNDDKAFQGLFINAMKF